MSYKEVLHDSIDIFFRETVVGLMQEHFGMDWFEKELLPQMRVYLQCGEDPKVAQKYEDFLKRRKTFEFADATLCSAILIYDSKYSCLLKREVVENHLKRIVWFRNQCAHNGGNDISYDLYVKGIAKLKETIVGFPNNYYSENLLSRVGVPREKECNRRSNYTNSYTGNYENFDRKIWGEEESVLTDDKIRNNSFKKVKSVRIGFLLWLILSFVLFVCGVVITVRIANVVTKKEVWDLLWAFAITYFVVLWPLLYVRYEGGVIGSIGGIICAAALAILIGLFSIGLSFAVALPGVFMGGIVDLFASTKKWKEFFGNDFPIYLCYGLFIGVLVITKEGVVNLIKYPFEGRWVDSECEVKNGKVKEPTRKENNIEREGKKTKSRKQEEGVMKKTILSCEVKNGKVKELERKENRVRRRKTKNRKQEERVSKRIILSCVVCCQRFRVPVKNGQIIAKCPRCNKEVTIEDGEEI